MILISAKQGFVDVTICSLDADQNVDFYIVCFYGIE